MTGQKKKYKRREVLSSPKEQLRIIRLFALLAVFYAGTGWYIGKSTLKNVGADISALPASSAFKQDVDVVLHQHAQTQDMQLAVFTFLTFTILVMGSVLLSHSIGGPIYQLRTYLAKRIAGEVAPRRISFRKNDFFHDLATAFNSFQEHFGLLEEDKADAPGDAPSSSAEGGD